MCVGGGGSLRQMCVCVTVDNIACDRLCLFYSQ